MSLAAVAAFALVGIPTIGYFTGLAGVAKYWLMPWLGYHFWMSTFTVVHHTAPHIPFKPAEEWNAAKAQLSGTVHCDYPRWCATGRSGLTPLFSDMCLSSHWFWCETALHAMFIDFVRVWLRRDTGQFPDGCWCFKITGWSFFATTSTCTCPTT